MAIYMENSLYPCLILIGKIPVNKKMEFEQTFRIGFSSLSKDCISKNLSEDCDQPGLYYFFSLWSSEETLRNFKKSPEFQLLNGAFHALGKVGPRVYENVLTSEQHMHFSFS